MQSDRRLHRNARIVHLIEALADVAAQERASTAHVELGNLIAWFLHLTASQRDAIVRAGQEATRIAEWRRWTYRDFGLPIHIGGSGKGLRIEQCNGVLSAIVVGRNFGQGGRALTRRVKWWCESRGIAVPRGPAWWDRRPMVTFLEKAGVS